MWASPAQSALIWSGHCALSMTTMMSTSKAFSCGGHCRRVSSANSRRSKRAVLLRSWRCRGCLSLCRIDQVEDQAGELGPHLCQVRSVLRAMHCQTRVNRRVQRHSPRPGRFQVADMSDVLFEQMGIPRRDHFLKVGGAR